MKQSPDTGCIILHRKMMCAAGYFAEPFCKRFALIDLLLSSNKDGQIDMSVQSLAIRWKWSLSKVNRFLKILEKDGQIVQEETRIVIMDNDSYKVV